jgi:hypothetical protein
VPFEEPGQDRLARQMAGADLTEHRVERPLAVQQLLEP